MTPSIMRRVMLSKHLLRQGAEQARIPGLLAGLAILSLHDAAEIFLQAASEHKGTASTASQSFSGYWTALEKVGCKLSRQGSMERLNRARVTLKHGGVLPDRAEVAGFLADVEGFLADSCPLAFGVKFEAVSLSALIRSDNIRTVLQRGEAAFSKRKYADSVERAAMAFTHALEGFAESDAKLVPPGIETPFAFTMTGFVGADADLQRAFSQMAMDVTKQITVLAYHLDYDGYRYLRTFGPVITPVYVGGHTVHWGRSKEDVTEEIASRCMSFAIDAALRLEARP